MWDWTAWTIFWGGLATLGIYSFLIKENSFYRLFEHLFIGIAAGLGTIYGIRNFIWPLLIVPIFGLDIDVYPDGTLSKEYQPLNVLYLFPMAFGLLYYFIYSHKYAWLAKLVIGFQLGAAGGLAFKGFFAEIIPQLSSSFKPLVVMADGGVNWYISLSNMVFVFTLVSVMLYFFFTFRTEHSVLSKVSSSGRWLMMVCFGAFFGSTVMARMALLVERLQFLIQDWYPLLASVAFGGVA